MLTAYQIETLRSKSEQLVDPITEFLIDDIAKRVAEAGQLTGTASYETWQLQKLGVSQKKLKKEIAKRLKISQKEAEKLLTQAAKAGYDFDISRFPAKEAIPLSANKSLQQVLDATVKLANDELANITQTIGFVGPDGICRELTDAYNQACDFAFQKVSAGAQDYTSAIRDAVKNLADKGIRTIDYESGVHTSLEAAVRRNMMGGLGLMQEQISQNIHDEVGCDGWEISAHAGSAPDHAPFQGRQYTDEEYKALNNSLVRRIGTLNCGHSAMPIILGVNEPQYSDEELEDFRQKNEEGVTFDGKHYTLYEATQRQRKFERTIRKQKRRILVDEATGDKDKLLIDQVKLQRLKQEYTRFSKGVGLPAQHARMEAAGFDWKKGKAAEKAYKNSQSSSTQRKMKLNEGIFSTLSISRESTVRPKSIMREMKKSEIGRALLEYLQENNVPVRICYGMDNPNRLCGSYDPFDDVITVYGDVTKTKKETAVTVIHEAMHRKLGSTHTFAEEVECYKAEIIHKKGRLTKADIVSIIEHVRKYYPELR